MSTEDGRQACEAQDELLEICDNLYINNKITENQLLYLRHLILIRDENVADIYDEGQNYDPVNTIYMAKALYKLANLQTTPTTSSTTTAYTNNTTTNNNSNTKTLNVSTTNTLAISASGASSPVSKHKKSKGGKNYDQQEQQQVQKQVTKVSKHLYI